MRKRPQLVRQMMSVVSAGALLVALCSCESPKPETATDAAKNSGNADLFTIPQDQMSHLQILTMQPTTLQRTLRLTGAVAYNNFRTTPVITQVGGPVSRMVVAPGQNVKKGAIMLYVASPDFSQLRTNYMKAKDADTLAQKEYARSQDLYAHHAIAEKDLLA